MLLKRLSRIFESNNYIDSIDHIIFKIETINEKDELELYRLNKFLLNICYFRMIHLLDTIYYFPERIKIHIEISSSTGEWFYKALNAIHSVDTIECDFDINEIKIEESLSCRFKKFANYIEYIENTIGDITILNPSDIGKFTEVQSRKLSNAEIIKFLNQRILILIENKNKNIRIYNENVTKENKKVTELKDRKLFSHEIKLTYRSLCQYLDLVNDQFDKLIANKYFLQNEDRRKLKIYVFEYLLEMCFSLIFEIPNGELNQKLAEDLRYGFIDLNSKVKKKTNDDSNIEDEVNFYIADPTDDEEEDKKSNENHSRQDSNNSFFDKNTENQRDKENHDIPLLFITHRSIILAFTEDNFYKMNKVLFIENMETIEFEENIEKYFGKSQIALDQYDNKDDPTQLQTKLFRDMGMNPNEIEQAIDKSKNFENGKGYILTKDNYQKILVIDQKMRAGIPLILMGETGCGKTYLLEYYAKVLRNNEVLFEKLVMHAGVTESNIVDLMNDKIEQAESNPGKEIWIFFDEINTSIYQKLISDLIIDRIYSFGPIKCSFLLFINTISLNM